MKRLRTLNSCLLPLLLSVIAGCSGDRQGSEVARQVSPNQKLVAVLMETLTGGGANGSVHEDLYVGDREIPLNFDHPVLSMMNCDALKFSWANDYTLEVHYPMSCVISHFTNRWARPTDVQVGRPNPIEIILVRE